MQNKNIILSIFAILCLSSGSFCFGASTSAKLPQIRESNSYFYAPVGIVCNAVLSESVHSTSAIVGQNVSVILINDLKYKDKVIATSGSTISGTITQNKIAGKGSSQTKLKIRFTTIRTLYNNVIPISAIILTGDKSGYIIANSNKEAENSVMLAANSKINLLFDQPITVTAQ